MAISCVVTMSLPYDAKAKRTRFDLRRFKTKLLESLRLGSYPRDRLAVLRELAASRLSTTMQLAGSRRCRDPFRQALPAGLIMAAFVAAVHYMYSLSILVKRKNCSLIKYLTRLNRNPRRNQAKSINLADSSASPVSASGTSRIGPMGATGKFQPFTYVTFVSRRTSLCAPVNSLLVPATSLMAPAISLLTPQNSLFPGSREFPRSPLSMRPK
jgi:hypothetical protein